MAVQRRTGHNKPCTSLSIVESNTLELINKTSISGHTESLASKVLFSFDDVVDGNLMTMFKYLFLLTPYFKNTFST